MNVAENKMERKKFFVLLRFNVNQTSLWFTFSLRHINKSLFPSFLSSSHNAVDSHTRGARLGLADRLLRFGAESRVLLHKLECLSAGEFVDSRDTHMFTKWKFFQGTAKFNPQNINPYLCTHLIYAFGGFTKDNQLKPFDKYQDIEQGSVNLHATCRALSMLKGYRISQVATPSSRAWKRTIKS